MEVHCHSQRMFLVQATESVHKVNTSGFQRVASHRMSGGQILHTVFSTLLLIELRDDADETRTHIGERSYYSALPLSTFTFTNSLALRGREEHVTFSFLVSWRPQLQMFAASFPFLSLHPHLDRPN